MASQIHWNLLFREEEEEHIPAVRRHGMGIVPYFPLESGLLTGKYRPGDYPQGSRLTKAPRFAELASEENFAYIERLRRFAEDHGHSLLDLAFGWLAAQEGVGSVIAGATTADAGGSERDGRGGVAIDAGRTPGTAGEGELEEAAAWPPPWPSP